ncbi:MAG: bifunctional metallophosphatase/5'-nucleotidase [Bacteroidales bacterium]|nr:bifunctional metallophosphatase/5'-nucleotidase [Bacteroidales bacterium]
MKIEARLLCLLAVLFVVGFAKSDKGTQLPQSPVVILFENDVHCAVEGYAKMAALKAEEQVHTPYVTVVSSGDFVQGDVIGSVTEGESIVGIMNRVGYDFVAPGNHEFDFGMERLQEIARDLQAEELCANFTSNKTQEPVFKPYGIVDYGGCQVAFIGLITPSTATSVIPKTFQDEEGNVAYGFNSANLFTCAQQWIDKSRSEGADYVIVLSHLGDIKEGDYPTSVEFIGNTTGVDVVLDGHSHTVIPDSLVLDKEGRQVLLASTGSRFEFVGKLELSVEGKFSSELLPAETLQDAPEVAAFVEELKEGVLAAGERIVGHLEEDLLALDSNGDWLVRDRQMPIGTFCADAFREVLGTDIAMINGGGIRNNLYAGDISYNDLLSVFPFGNNACTVSLTGAQLADILEASVRSLPLPSGSFMQVSGVRYNCDVSVASPVELDDSGLFLGIRPGASRRVSDVQVLDKSTGNYLPVNPSATYTLGGIDYNLANLGSDGMFRYTKLLRSNQGLDVDVLSQFLSRRDFVQLFGSQTIAK